MFMSSLHSFDLKEQKCPPSPCEKWVSVDSTSWQVDLETNIFLYLWQVELVTQKKCFLVPVDRWNWWLCGDHQPCSDCPALDHLQVHGSRALGRDLWLWPWHEHVWRLGRWLHWPTWWCQHGQFHWPHCSSGRGELLLTVWPNLPL